MKIQDRGRRSPAPQTGGDFWRASTRPERHPLGNLIYLGTGLRSLNGKEPEPALIDPRLTIDSRVKDCRGGGQGWEPSYSGCSPQMRAAYLLWLNLGRSDPRAPISHVLLYFYGLERRAVHDARSEPAAHADVPAIREEVGRLRRLYGSHERFKERSTALLEFLAAEGLPARSYLQAPVLRDEPLTYVEQLMLGQCAQDAVPLPATWAFRFVQGGLRMWPEGLDSRGLRALCECFEQIYHQRCGPGLVVPAGLKPLQLRYWPASPTFDGVLQQVTVESGLPSLLEEPQWCRPLAAVVREVQARLAGEALLPAAGALCIAGGTQGLLTRPLDEWPEGPRSVLEDLRARVRQGTYTVMHLSDLAGDFQLQSLTPQSLQRLCEALERAGIGMMPDPRFGDLPSRPERAVLFIDDPSTASSAPSEPYGAAALRLELPCAVMGGDRAFLRAHEPQLLAALRVEQAVSSSERRRLTARLHLILHEPPSLGSLNRRLKMLTPAQRLRAAEHLASVVDPPTSNAPVPVNVQLVLERCLELLGPQGPGTRPAGAPPSATLPQYAPRKALPPRGYRISATLQRPRPPEVSLDPAKIAALRMEEARLAELLDPVFTEADTPEPLTKPSSCEPQISDSGPGPACLLGLDPAASTFLRMLLGRSMWTRSELTGLAREHSLPLDGVLERINEASFERLDMPLFEDTDPLLLLPEAVAAITAEA